MSKKIGQETHTFEENSSKSLSLAARLEKEARPNALRLEDLKVDATLKAATFLAATLAKRIDITLN